MNEHLRALEVSQELMAETKPPMRALDETGNVGHREAAIAAQADNPEIRRQRGERIVGDLRAGRGDSRDQRRLARVGKADQADIGEHLHLEPKNFLFTGTTGLGAPRGAVRRRREARVAAAATTAPGHEHALSRARQIGAESPRVVRIVGPFVNERSDWHGQLEVRAGEAGAVRAHAVLARGRR